MKLNFLISKNILSLSVLAFFSNLPLFGQPVDSESTQTNSSYCTGDSNASKATTRTACESGGGNWTNDTTGGLSTTPRAGTSVFEASPTPNPSANDAGPVAPPVVAAPKVFGRGSGTSNQQNNSGDSGR